MRLRNKWLDHTTSTGIIISTRMRCPRVILWRR